ncbi:MAG: alpha/beta hydrolase [Rhodococcus sp. (in: high G+C Gram-positive bacteria)]
MTVRYSILTAAVAGVVLAGAARALARRRTEVPSARLRDTDELLGEIDVEPRVRTVTASDGASLHVREYGDPDADPMVLSHGWACSADFWTPQINDLAGRYRVVVYDQRGHGASEVGTRPLGADVLGDDLAAVLGATVTTDRKAVLVGHSMGGMSIMAWAGRYPDQIRDYVKAIMLANTASDSLLRETTLIPLPPGIPAVPTRLATTLLGSALPIPANPLTVRAMKYATMGAGSTRSQVAFCERIVRECTPRTRGMWGSALSTLDIRDAVERIDVPTSVLVGSSDRLTPPVHARQLARRLSAAGLLSEDGTKGRLVEIHGVGHMSSVEDIATFDAELVRLASL